jgi:hypothetical protein
VFKTFNYILLIYLYLLFIILLLFSILQAYSKCTSFSYGPNGECRAVENMKSTLNATSLTFNSGHNVYDLVYV